MNTSRTTTSQPRSLRHAVALAALTMASLASFGAHAAGQWSADRQQIEDTYRAERADCLAGNTTQDRDSCLYEARSVRRDALAGLKSAMTIGAATELKEPDYQANALMRCDALPADARSDCSRRVNGEGIVVGSVAEGIIVRELPAEPQLALVGETAAGSDATGSTGSSMSAGGEDSTLSTSPSDSPTMANESDTVEPMPMIQPQPANTESTEPSELQQQFHQAE